MIPFIPDIRNSMLGELFKNGVGLKTSIEKDKAIDLNLWNINPNEKLYRIFPLERFREMLLCKQNVLVRPSLWEDPFENYLFNSAAITEDGQIIDLSGVGKCLYAQCWTMNPECDGLWRTYTDNKRNRAVKVSTKALKLLRSLYDFVNKFHCLRYFLGKVIYCDDSDFNIAVDNGMSNLTDTSGVATIITLLQKRIPFKYEQEVRLIFRAENEEEADGIGKVYKYQINPVDLFEEIEMDPWASTEDIANLDRELKDQGFAVDINRSSLYAKPNFKIIFGT